MFSYLREYFDFSIPLFLDNGSLLQNEAERANSQIGEVIYSEAGDRYAAVKADVYKLALGDFDDEIAQFIEARRVKAKLNSTRLRTFLAHEPSLSVSLKGVSAATFPEYLESQKTGLRAQQCLVDHLSGVMRGKSFEERVATAKILIESEFAVVSRALTRNRFYLHWRCANQNSVSSDVYDDAFHVVNAAYCDFFVTKDQEQAGYAPLIVPGTSVILMKHGEGLLDRLLAEIG